VKIKVAICIPCYGDPKGKFLQSLLNMTDYFYRARLEAPDGTPYEKEIQTFIVSSSMLTEVRHRLVAEALGWGADYMLCLDADHTFADDLLDRLLSHNLMIVGCNYVRRSLPTAPTAARLDKVGDGYDGLLYTTPEMAAAELVEPVAHIGMGGVLINMRVFDILQADAEAKGESSFLPLFKFEPAANGKGMRGEDVYFFEKCRAAGIDVNCDHAASWTFGHCHDIIMINQMAIDQRDAFDKADEENRSRFLPKSEVPAPNARIEGGVSPSMQNRAIENIMGARTDKKLRKRA